MLVVKKCIAVGCQKYSLWTKYARKLSKLIDNRYPLSVCMHMDPVDLFFSAAVQFVDCIARTIDM
jgi:hypothetical protein